jgi:hippurate hydrolase
MAAAEIFKVRINGKGGHGAVPHLAVDPVLAAAHVISALQSIAARNVPPLESAVISVTSIHAGETFNVIPPVVDLQGTIRTFDAAIRQRSSSASIRWSSVGQAL